MKIVTLNANGLRSAFRKGLRDWVGLHKPDILCIQETKAQLSKLCVSEYAIEGYQVYFEDAKKAGYSGVAVYAKVACRPREDHLWTHFHVQSEARVMVLDCMGFDLINVYLPSGTSGDERQAIKWELMQSFRIYLQQWQLKPCIVLGDFNIAHQTIDLKNWRNNQKNSGFLPHERQWLSEWLSDGWVDTLRYLAPEVEQYTWWSQRANARARNVGWRIDYQFITKPFEKAIKQTYVDCDTLLSDHAPYVVEYAYETFLHQKL